MLSFFVPSSDPNSRPPAEDLHIEVHQTTIYGKRSQPPKNPRRQALLTPEEAEKRRAYWRERNNARPVEEELARKRASRAKHKEKYKAARQEKRARLRAEKEALAEAQGRTTGWQTDNHSDTAAPLSATHASPSPTSASSRGA